ncbi:hypothetical protein PMI01_04677, partial [Caulobacter sp. AP07]
AAISRKAGRGGFRLRDPSSVGYADTFSRKGRRNQSPAFLNARSTRSWTSRPGRARSPSITAT